MSNIAKSLATLVKYNGGFFKSEKQAKFLNSVTNGVLVVSNAVCLGYEYNNKQVGQGAKTVYTLDDKGVLTVERHNAKGIKTTFDRNCPKSVQANKERLAALEAQKVRDTIEQARLSHKWALQGFSEALSAHIKALLNTSIEDLYSNAATKCVMDKHGKDKNLSNKIEIYLDLKSNPTMSMVLDVVIYTEKLPTMADKIDEVITSDYYQKVKAYKRALDQQIITLG